MTRCWTCGFTDIPSRVGTNRAAEATAELQAIACALEAEAANADAVGIEVLRFAEDARREHNRYQRTPFLLSCVEAFVGRATRVRGDWRHRDIEPDEREFSALALWWSRLRSRLAVADVARVEVDW